MVQFETVLKIDFNLWTSEILAQAAAAPHLPPEFDAGYVVLVDKDQLTAVCPFVIRLKGDWQWNSNLMVITGCPC